MGCYNGLCQIRVSRSNGGGEGRQRCFYSPRPLNHFLNELTESIFMVSSRSPH